MIKTIITSLVISFLSVGGYANSAEFACEKINDKQVRKLCIQDRAEREKAAVEASAAQEREKAVIAEKSKEFEKAASSAQHALKELKRLEVRVSTGVSYSDYPAVLSNAKFEVLQFTESPYAKSLPEVTAAMILAIDHYDNARTLWSYKFVGGGVPAKVVSTALSGEENYVEALATKYKGISENDSGYKRIFIDRGILIVWEAAANEIHQAEKLLQ